jgi:two-component sensor histidine kinase
MHIGAFERLRFPTPLESAWQCYGLAIGSFAISLLLRFALNQFFLPPYAGYILFIPAVAFTTLFAGFCAGLLTTLLSLLAVWYLFLSPYQTIAVSLVRAADYVVVTGILLGFIQWVRVTISQLETERRNLQAASAREKDLIKELQHRGNNLFAVIHSLAIRTLDPSDSRQAFLGRLAALSRSDHRLLDTASKGTTLHYLIHSELDPFAGRFIAEGDYVLLDSTTAQNFSIILHELATNASKYGAFSTSTGKVGLSWSLGGNGNQSLKFIWKESGGPAVGPPMRQGLGTTLVKSALGPAKLEFLPEGLLYLAEVKLGSLN